MVVKGGGGNTIFLAMECTKTLALVCVLPLELHAHLYDLLMSSAGTKEIFHFLNLDYDWQLVFL